MRAPEREMHIVPMPNRDKAGVLREDFNPECREILTSADAKAQITDCEQVLPCHLMMAALNDGGYLDRSLRAEFRGLHARTVAESLEEIVAMSGGQAEAEATRAGDVFQTPCSPAALRVLVRAKELSGIWGRSAATLPALICAALEQPDSFTVEAFADAAIDRGKLLEMSAGIARKEAPGDEPESAGKSVFADDCVNLDSFGPVAHDALLTLAQMGEGRQLLAEDLLLALLLHERSRTLEGLHVLGRDADTVVSTLQRQYGTVRGPRGTAVPRSRMIRMLVRILEQAGTMAASEHSDLIGESHLMRTYFARVGFEPGNMLEKLGVPARELADYLKKYPVDREGPEATEGAEKLIRDVEGYLAERVVGQEEAVRTVVPAVQRMRLKMNEPGRPMGVFLFLGATGVGKTELAKALADIAFGAKPGVVDPYLIRIDCGALTEPRDIVQLLGAPQGLVGYKEGRLPNGLREKGGRCIILFDEAEKAHPKVWQSLLTFFDEAIVTEADGTRYDATGCILIATSNLGFKDATEKFRIFDLPEEDLDRTQSQIKAFIWKAVESYFSPEFRGRFGRQNVIFFNNFRRRDYRHIIVRQVSRLVDEMALRGIEVAVSEDAIECMLAMAWEGRQNGARDVARILTACVRNRIVDARIADPTTRKIKLGLSEEMEEFLRQRASDGSSKEAKIDLEAMLNARVMHQERAIRAVLPALQRMRSGLHERGRLKGAFLFLGATGVGKTELARAIADIAYGNRTGAKDANLILINCGTMTEPRDIVQILGAPQGLVGYKEGSLTNGLRDKGGRCVILFDEAEKAHPKIWQSLLQLFDEGLVTEADGTEYDATECVLIATSNLGYAEAIEKFRIYDRPAAEVETLRPQFESLIWKRVSEYFSPEFRGRFGHENVLFFNHFDLDAYRQMLASQLQRLATDMQERGIEIVIDPPLLDGLTELAWEKRAEGARPVRRLVDQYARDVVVQARLKDPKCERVVLGMNGKLERDHAEALAKKAARRVDDVEGLLNSRVINQAQAVRMVVPAIKRMRVSMNEPGRMVGAFLFLGPSGVGKTELAKAIADAVFGPKPGVVDPYMIRIDCGRFTEPRDIVQLLGAPQGLVGYKEGALTNGLREKGGRCVILFDEAEKANPQIWQSLLTFFDEGIVTEADGTRYDATGCVLIATSNLGYKDAVQAFRLFEIDPEDAEDLRKQVEEFIWNKVTSYFSPEFLGRFGRENVILFNHFRRSDYTTILRQQMFALEKEMEEKGMACTFSDEVVEKLVDLAWEKRNEGARTVRRLISGYIRNTIVDGVEADPARTVYRFFVRDDGDIVAGDR